MREASRAAARALTALGAAALLAAGCAHAPPPVAPEVVWSGEVPVPASIEIPPGQTLVIQPGTRVLFAFRDDDRDGKGDVSIVVHGSLVAEGDADRPIVFAPADPGPGAAPVAGWGEIRLEKALRASFERCRFSGAQNAVHGHLTPMRVDACTFSGNDFGMRFRGGPVLVRDSLFEDNGTAVRFWESDPLVEGNRFRRNATAVFCHEGSSGTVLRGNAFEASADYHVKLGELQAGDVDARDNWWGTDREEEIERMVFDREDEGYLGRVLFRPFETQPPQLEGAAAGGEVTP